MNKYIEKIESKIQKEKDILKYKVLPELKEQFEEADGSYRDSGFDRYYNKMNKLQEQIDEIEEYLNIRPEVSVQAEVQQISENRKMCNDLKSIRSHWIYLKNELNLPYTRDGECIDEILKDYGGLC